MRARGRRRSSRSASRSSRASDPRRLVDQNALALELADLGGRQPRDVAKHLGVVLPQARRRSSVRWPASRSGESRSRVSAGAPSRDDRARRRTRATSRCGSEQSMRASLSAAAITPARWRPVHEIERIGAAGPRGDRRVDLVVAVAALDHVETGESAAESGDAAERSPRLVGVHADGDPAIPPRARVARLAARVASCGFPRAGGSFREAGPRAAVRRSRTGWPLASRDRRAGRAVPGSCRGREARSVRPRPRTAPTPDRATRRRIRTVPSPSYPIACESPCPPRWSGRTPPGRDGVRSRRSPRSKRGRSAGLSSRQSIEAETELRHHARREVLDHDVGLSHQRLEDALRRGKPQIQRDPAPIAREIVERAVAIPRSLSGFVVGEEVRDLGQFRGDRLRAAVGRETRRR